MNKSIAAIGLILFSLGFVSYGYWYTIAPYCCINQCGCTTSIRVFNKELRAADIPTDLKKTIEDCFALGLTSAFMIELRIIIMEAKEK